MSDTIELTGEAALAALRLAISDEAPELLRAARSRSRSESELERAAMAYVNRAIALGAPPEAWTARNLMDLRITVDPKSGWVTENERFISVFYEISKAEHGDLAIKALLKGGAGCMWASEAVAVGGEPRFVAHQMSSRDLNVQWWEPTRDARSSLILTAALGGQRAQEALEWVDDIWTHLLSFSSYLALGRLGSRDEDGLKLARLIELHEKELLEAANRVGGEREIERAMEMASMARDYIEAKSQPAEPKWSPEAIREKESHREELAQAQALARGIELCAGQDAFVERLMDAALWLADNPQLASLSLDELDASEQSKMNESLMGVVISSGSGAALRRLERAGSNIWLAAAQEDSGNAVSWALDKANRSHQKLDVETLARMLMEGSDLTRAKRPRERCLELCEKALDHIIRDNGADSAAARAGALKSALERLELAREAAAPASSKPQRAARM